MHAVKWYEVTNYLRNLKQDSFFTFGNGLSSHHIPGEVNIMYLVREVPQESVLFLCNFNVFWHRRINAKIGAILNWGDIQPKTFIYM